MAKEGPSAETRPECLVKSENLAEKPFQVKKQAVGVEGMSRVQTAPRMVGMKREWTQLIKGGANMEGTSDHT